MQNDLHLGCSCGRPAKLAYTVAQAAEQLNVSTQQILKYVKATDHTHLPARQVGRAFSIAVKDLEEWHSRQPIV